MKKRSTVATVHSIKDGKALVAPKGKREYVLLAPEMSDRLNRDVELLVADGACTKTDYARLGFRYGVSWRTVQNRVGRLRSSRGAQAGQNQRHTQNVLPENVLTLISAHGQVKAVWEEACNTGKYVGSLSTFYRQVEATHGARTIRGITRGIPAIRRGTFEQLERALFMQGYSIDVFYLRTSLAGGSKGDKPTGAIVRETLTGVAVGSWIWPSDEVAASDISVLLAEAFRGRMFTYKNEVVFVGGLPDFVRSDNGRQFTAVELGELLNPLAVRVITSNDYRSNENGAHETIHGLLRSELLARLPGSEDGNRDHRGKLHPDERQLVTLTEAREMLDAWCWRFNTSVGKDGTTRMDAWVEGINLSDGQLPETVKPETLARYAIERAHTAKLYKLGILVDTHHYTHPDLDEYSAKRFVISRWLRDDRTIEVFTPNGQYVCTAVRNGELAAAESVTLQVASGETEKRVKNIVAQARAQYPLPEFTQVPIHVELPSNQTQDVKASPRNEADTSLSDLADILRKPTTGDSPEVEGQS
jgi:hypothetical protein